MPVSRVTASQFRDALRREILNRAEDYDVGFGPIRDIVIDPVSSVLEQQNDRIRQVSLLISLLNPTALNDEDVDAFVANEGLRRIQGERAVATLTFYTTAVDPSGPDLVVQQGYPVATRPDQQTGETVTFVTTEPATLPVASASSFFNIETQRFELTVPARATVDGVIGNVAANRIQRTLRPLVGFAGVTNTRASTGGRGRESNAQLIERYLLSVRGTDISTPSGVTRFIRNRFASVTDVSVVFGENPLLTRADTASGAVDAYVQGEQLLTRVEAVEFVGPNQLIVLDFPPVRSVVSVVSGATTYIEGADFELVRDTSDNEDSVRAVEGIRFLPGASSPPSPGDAVTVTYASNQLVRDIQNLLDDDDNLVFGRDLLVKEGTDVPVIIEARLRVEAGFNGTTVIGAVQSTLLNFVNGLQFGANVEESDLQGEVRRVTGVDNFIIDRLVRDPTMVGVSDLVIGDNEFATLAAADVSITQV